MDEEEGLPSAWLAFSPIIVPIVLILINTIVTALKIESGAAELAKFIGSPIVAVSIGLLIAIYGLTKHTDRNTVIEDMEKGIRSAGIIILVTGGGGALGMVLRDSGVGSYIAEVITKTSIPPILLPFIIATLIRLIQGSGTVAMLTAASITAPIIATMNVNPVFAALAACIGSLFFSYFNDSFFWVVNRTMGIKDPTEQIRVYSVTSTIAWGTGIVSLLVINMFFG